MTDSKASSQIRGRKGEDCRSSRRRRKKALPCPRNIGERESECIALCGALSNTISFTHTQQHANQLRRRRNRQLLLANQRDRESARTVWLDIPLHLRVVILIEISFLMKESFPLHSGFFLPFSRIGEKQIVAKYKAVDR